MNAEIRQLDPLTRSGQHATPRLRTLVVCDIADSTALVERIGDQNAANIIRKHDRLARALVEQHQGREIDKTDGFLLLFERPIQAVAFALDYQRGLKHLSAAEGVVLRARVGIHMGDVVIWENAPEDVARGAKPIEVEGLVKPVAARLAQLALPQQTLVSSAAAGIARRAQRELGRESAERVHWREHGRYRFKGVPEPMEVVEVGEEKIAPLHAPRSGRTAKKILPWYRRPLTLAAEAAMLAIGIGVGAWLLLQSPPTLAFAKRDWVVVGDLQNNTNERVYDNALDTAIRMGLEESRYVNVVPGTQIKDALSLMRRPRDSSLDRSTARDVAIREGARALIMPSISEVGDKVRINAEVVDPNSGATVYVESAEATGDAAALKAADRVVHQLRYRLGETLASIKTSSVPLEKVATPNLDALRAYGLALRASAIGDSKNENELLQHALELDPGFAAAYLRLAGNVLPWDKAQAFAYFSKAYEHKDRLGPRDQLYIEAWRAMFGDPSEAIEKWHLLAEMYPDFMAGQENMGVLLWQKENRFAQAVAPLKQVAASKHPLHVMAYDLLGHVYLGMNDYQASLKAYDSAQRLGLQTLDYGVAGTYIAMRNYDEAERVLSNFKKPADANFALNRWTWQAVLAADQGHLQQALAVLEEGRKEAIQRKAENFALKFQAMALSLQVAMSPDTGLPADLRDFQKSLAEKLPSAPKHEQAQIAELLVFVAYLDGRIGKSKQAQLALDASSPYTDPTDPVSASLRSLAKAELLDPSEANALLSPLSQGDELCQVHSALLRIAKRQKDAEGIRKQAQWLAANRGRALAEWNDGYLLGPLNLVDADEAVVEQAKSPSAPSGIR